MTLFLLNVYKDLYNLDKELENALYTIQKQK
ncbi:hypothetical protein AAKU52_003351 [Pedobacter sp. CG_S7]